MSIIRTVLANIVTLIEFTYLALHWLLTRCDDT